MPPLPAPHTHCSIGVSGGQEHQDPRLPPHPGSDKASSPLGGAGEGRVGSWDFSTITSSNRVSHQPPIPCRLTVLPVEAYFRHHSNIFSLLLGLWWHKLRSFVISLRFWDILLYSLFSLLLWLISVILSSISWIVSTVVSTVLLSLSSELFNLLLLDETFLFFVSSLFILLFEAFYDGCFKIFIK